MDGVASTAVAVAAGRALESSRPDALVRDPWAAVLVERAGVQFTFPERWPDDPLSVEPFEQSLLIGSLYVGLRTRFIDDQVAAAGLRQVVILGSGLDTRAWRLDWPVGTVVFELDAPEIIDFVSSVMEGEVASCTRIPIAADVTAPWASRIVANGFRPDAPTTWVMEGLLPYLSAADQSALLDDLTALSAPGSHAVIERATAIEDSPQARERLETFSRMTGLPMTEVLARADPPDPATVLTEHGWTTGHVSIAALEKRYGRTLSLDASKSAPAGTRGGLVLARRPSHSAT